MLYNKEKFEALLGTPVPPELTSLYTEKSLYESMPLGFRFSHVGFILELQYLLDMSDTKNYDIENKRFSFAVNTDGYELLIDLNNDHIEIYQCEYGDIDSIGLIISDLLEAEKYSL